jgi:hypothetical protein
MLTSAECQARADEKLARAEREPRNHKRLLAAAEGWVILAGIMGRLEGNTTLPTKKRRK